MASTSPAESVISPLNALPLTFLDVGTLPPNALFTTLFCTGLVEVELRALSTTVLFAPVAMPFNFSKRAVVKDAVVASSTSLLLWL